MSELGRLDANLADLLNSSRYPCEEKSCYNCSHQGWEPGDESVGMDGYVFCDHPEIGMNSDDDGAGYLMLQEYVESQGKEGGLEDEIASICPHYYPVMVNRCHGCGKLINQPEHLWFLYADSFCEHVGNYPVPVCSQECLEAANEKAKTDAKDYEQMMLNLDSWQAQAWAEDNYQPTAEEEHLADLAFDATRERRFTHRMSRD